MTRHIVKKGFTLFELLLVIAIIAVIASLGILTYRRHAEQLRVNRAALEMQQVLSAAMAFNANNSGTWPEAYDAGSCQSTTAPTDTDNFVANYLPNQTYFSNFGSHFCWSEDPSSNRFWVALPFAAGEENVAAKIASILPFGVTTQDLSSQTPVHCTGSQTCFVKAEVVQPAAAAVAKGETHVAGVGRCVWGSGSNQVGSSSNVTCDEGSVSGGVKSYTIHFKCDAQEQGYVMFMPNSFYLGASGSHRLMLNMIRVTGENDCTTTASGDVSCSLGVTLQTGSTTKVSDAYDKDGTLSGSYLAYCRATSSAKQVVRY